MLTLETLKQRREEILQVAERWGAHNLRIFGSLARGEAGPDSDIDFLVELDPERSLLDQGGLLMDLQDLLGENIDLVTENGLSGRFRERVLTEARPL